MATGVWLGPSSVDTNLGNARIMGYSIVWSHSMLKPLLGITAGGVLALILWKVVALALPPLVAIGVGVIIWLFKAAIITVGVIITVLLLIWVNRRMARSSASAARSDS